MCVFGMRIGASGLQTLIVYAKLLALLGWLLESPRQDMLSMIHEYK